MAYSNSRIRREIGQYLKSLGEQGLEIRYVQQQKSTLMAFLNYLREQGIVNSKYIDAKSVLEFLKRYELKSAGYQAHVQTFLRKFLAHCDNPAMLKMKIAIKGTGRTRVDWLEPEELDLLFETLMTPEQMILIGGGILQGMRRVELLRMTVADVADALKTNLLRIRGKGRKERSIPVQSDFKIMLDTYLKYLEPEGTDQLILDFSRSKAENLLDEFCARYGKRFTHHTLRRSFGRALWLKGIQIETIGELLGHKSVDQTKMYLGLNLNDMQKALSCYKIARNCTLINVPGQV